jgi:DNA-binding HxlR family transcriptional regulator
MDCLNTLIALSRRRWALPALAELHRADGLKFVTLVHRLAASRPAAREALDDLVELGLAMPNPGYGHPLRPEYILTPAGARIGPACAALWDLLRRLRIADLALRRWSLAVLAALGAGKRRFSEIRGLLPAVTDRALIQAIRSLQTAGLVTRRVSASSPPATRYQPTPRARRLLQVMGTLP